MIFGKCSVCTAKDQEIARLVEQNGKLLEAIQKLTEQGVQPKREPLAKPAVSAAPVAEPHTDFVKRKPIVSPLFAALATEGHLEPPIEGYV